MPLGGGTPRELATNVSDADWSPDGTQLAIVHRVGGVEKLEFPIGTALYETPGYLSDVRIAPDGRHIAFLEHPERGDNRGFVAMVEIGGKHVALTHAFSAIEGLVWKPGGAGLVFSGSKAGGIGQLVEVTTRGDLHETAPDSGYRRISISDGRSQIVPGLTVADDVLRFSPDGKSVWTRQPNAIPVRVERVDLASGVRSALLPPFAFRRPGLSAIREVALADDPRNYVYIERENEGYLFELTTKR